MITRIRAGKTSQVAFTFDNGNSLSIIWGAGSYTGNHDMPFESERGPLAGPIESTSVEIMAGGDERFIRWFERKYGDNPGGYIPVADIPLVVRKADSKLYKSDEEDE